LVHGCDLGSWLGDDAAGDGAHRSVLDLRRWSRMLGRRPGAATGESPAALRAASAPTRGFVVAKLGEQKAEAQRDVGLDGRARRLRRAGLTFAFQRSRLAGARLALPSIKKAERTLWSGDEDVGSAFYRMSSA
jgi:hypothetical protein